MNNIYRAYREKTPASQKLFEKAIKIFPSGITHDIRRIEPYPLYMDRGLGSKKWDVDGNEYIDYWVGHGALFLGHEHPEVVKAVSEQVKKGNHFGSCHEAELRWALKVIELVPCAEKVRFVASGTEATHLAIRLARAFTGKDRVLKFEGHFHGWHDGMMQGVIPPYDIPSSQGIPKAISELTYLCPPNDIDAAKKLVESKSDIACAIIEPGGGSSATLPSDIKFLAKLRDLTKKHGIILIFDEVISGFRYAPGGAQEYFGVIPDMAALAKILAGGYPGGAVVGRGDLLDLISFTGDSQRNRFKRVIHQGTFNANPVSAVAGETTLRLISDGSLQKKANKWGETLRDNLNKVFINRGIDACAYGESSLFGFNFDKCELRKGCNFNPCKQNHVFLKTHKDLTIYNAFHAALILNGVDVPLYHGWISAIHDDNDMKKTVQAFEEAVKMLQKEGMWK